MGPRGAALVLSRVVPIGKKGPGGGGSKSRAGSGSGGGPPAGEGGMTDGPGGPATPLLRSLTHVDLTDALIGPVNALTVATWAAHPACALATLLLGGNGIAEMGGVALAKVPRTTPMSGPLSGPVLRPTSPHPPRSCMHLVFCCRPFVRSFILPPRVRRWN